MSQWYELVVFTASMEIYGTAVADKLDRNKGMLRRRYYRQHCTVDFGSYTKDLSAINPDLASVFILDNSPGAYRSYPGEENEPTSLNRSTVSKNKGPFEKLRLFSTLKQFKHKAGTFCGFVTKLCVKCPKNSNELLKKIESCEQKEKDLKSQTFPFSNCVI